MLFIYCLRINLFYVRSYKAEMASDDKYFRKYIENTTAHGVVRIFSGKSVIRRLFWLVIVLGASTGCLYNISNRIFYLAGGPTATTLSLERQNNLTFPAISVCNLNHYRRDVSDSIHPELGRTLRNAFYTEESECNYIVHDLVERANLSNLTLSYLTDVSRDPIESFIEACFFSGRRCSYKDFEPISTDTGYCYTFNIQEPFKSSTSTGVRAGLYLALNINQSQYVSSSSFDAGVKVVVHPQNEPPRPEDTGVGVPPGTNSFIGVRQKNIIDNTQRRCLVDTESYNFDFLPFDYSTIACGYDCLLVSIAENCGCNYIPPISNRFNSLPECVLSDLCCAQEQQRVTIDCDCQSSCSTTIYETYNSYSGFPALYIQEDLAELLNISLTDISSDSLSVNVYFETLNIETQTTDSSYGVVALLSDIGGQLGLFLGVSVISIMEFGTWIIDEIKSRLFGDKFSERKLCVCCKRKTIETDNVRHFDSALKDNVESEELSQCVEDKL